MNQLEITNAIIHFDSQIAKAGNIYLKGCVVKSAHKFCCNSIVLLDYNHNVIIEGNNAKKSERKEIRLNNISNQVTKIINQNNFEFSINGNSFTNLLEINNCSNFSANINNINTAQLSPSEYVKVIIKKCFNIEKLILKLIPDLDLNIVDCSIINILSLENLNLNTSKFNIVDFHKNCRIKLNKSILYEAEFINVQWPRNYKLDESIDDANYLRELKESYRQLKLTNERQLNKIDANYFEKNELNTHFKYINKYERGNFNDRFILGTYKFFGGWGLKLKFPILSWILMHFFLFIVAYIFTDLFILRNWPLCIWDTIKNFIYFAYPLHKLPENYATSEVIISILMKISSGYFIFYMVKASRKFHQ